MNARLEYLIRKKTMYLKASVQERTVILDEICKTTCLNRKYVIGLLQAKTDLKARKDRPPTKRPPTYTNEHAYYLKKIWNILDCPCGQRLVSVMTETIEALSRHKEISLSEGIREKLCHMSASTIDRLLKPWKAQAKRRVHGTTKPGSFLKKQIPIQLSRWDEKRLGFSEIDLCAHNGGNPEGEFANTLVDTDLASGWTEQQAFLGKAQKHVKAALIEIDQRRPFKRKGIDSDSGGEFLNWLMFKFCEDQEIKFTRGRPGKKNDNPYVEQKNWTHVRKVVGYHRYDTERQVHLLNDLYENELRLYENFFQPTIKLEEKRRIGGRVHRIYGKAKTPYQRIMESEEVSAEKKAALRRLYLSLNPADLKRKIEKKLDVLFKTVRRPSDLKKEK